MENEFTLEDYFLDWKNSLQENEMETMDKSPEYENQMEFGDMPAYVLVYIKIGQEKAVLVYRNNGQVPFKDGSNLKDYVITDKENTSNEDIDEMAKQLYDPGSPWATFVTVLW